MTTEKHDPWALLAEAREALVRAENRMMAPPHQVPDVIQHIDAALAAHADSATPVVESDDMWWQDKTFRAVVGSITVLVQSNGLHEWYWSATSSERRGKYGLLDSCQGRTNMLDEAKSAAIAAARGMR